VTKKQNPKSVYCVIGVDDNLLGYFKDFKAVDNFLERECIEEAVILEVVSAIDCSFPPEPEIEYTDRKLESLL
jgi:hypothetical protein